MTSMAIKNLDSDSKTTFAVMYKSIIYKIQDIEPEGSLRRLKLISLNCQDITIVLWHPDSVIKCSPLITKRCLITNFVSDYKFEVEGIKSALHIELSKEDTVRAHKWLVQSKSVYITLFFCFDEMHIGNIYCVRKN